jgi:16S rRNA (uracil1498-N3)-methyltransferase
MRNYRFYLSEIKSPTILVKDEALLHRMNNVLRLSKDSKEEIEFFDGLGNVFEVDLIDISKKEANFKVTSEHLSQRELGVWVKFYVPVIKPENYYWMIKKLTELGVSEFQPVFFERSQKKYKESLEKQNEKILIAIQEALEQCGGAKMPKYHDIKAFGDLGFDDKSPNNTDIARFFAYEGLSLEKNAKKAQVIPQLTDTIIMVGPEGGLTIDETGILGDKSFNAVSLGARLLKAETAAISLFTSLGVSFAE